MHLKVSEALSMFNLITRTTFYIIESKITELEEK